MTAPAGLLHDPVASRNRHVRVWCDGASLRLEGDGEPLVVPLSGVSFSSGGWRGEAIHVAWEQDGRSWAVTLPDAQAAEALASRLPAREAEVVRRLAKGGRRAARRGRVTYTVVGLIVAFPFLLLLTLFLLRGKILDLILDRLPVSVDRQLGELLQAELTASGRLLSSGPAPEGVREIGQRLLAARPDQPFQFRFEVLRDPGVNAFAAPGGLVVVFTGLITAAESPEELAGVLAHEVAHVLERHSMRQMVVSAGLVAAFRLAVGSPDGAAGVIAAAATDLASLRFSRDQERQADRHGLDLLQKARLPADGLIVFFQRLDGARAEPPVWLSSHPSSEHRAQLLRDEQETRGRWASEPLAVDWEGMRRQASESR
jgi:Zn-dependent protease with chaperone function